MVYVIGTFTFGAHFPGWKRQRLNVLTVELSKIGLPMDCAILASVTLPVVVSTLSKATPLPVTWRLRASYGYSGLGAKTATAFAPLIDIVPGTPAVGAFTGPVGLFCFGGGGFSSWNSG